jgi:integrase
MSKSEKTHATCLVDFIPGELREVQTWRIVYYVKNPFTHKLERKLIRVKPLKSISERRKLAKRMVSELNSRLLKGWNPYYENKNNKEFTKVFNVFDIYTKQIELEYKDGNLSMDTHRTYVSKINFFKDYLTSRELDTMFSYKLDRDLITEFLDFIRYDLNRSARTRDNYMTFLNTLCGWMVSKRYLNSNPCTGLKKTNRKAKNRVIIPSHERELIFDYYKETNINYLVFCMACYYCLARCTELSKIKVGDVDFENNTLFISAEDSKNNKSGHVTIPPRLAFLLAQHVKLAKANYYLFSEDNYAPGAIRFAPRKSTSNWARMRKKLNIKSEIKWYSLKDSGITDLIIAGVPLISVRDQARHHSIKQTDEYTPRSMKKADRYIQNSGINFKD